MCLPGRVKKKETDKDEDVKEEERELKDRRCFQCGDPGHVRRDCPEYRHLKQRAAAATGSRSNAAFHRCTFSLLVADNPGFSVWFLPAHTLRNMGSSQSLPVPQAPAEGPRRTRQTSECVSTRSINEPQMFS